MNPRIVFNTWSAAFFHPGGGEVQLNNSKLALEKLGYNIELYNQWSPQREFEIFHQFSIQLGTNYVVDSYKQYDKKIALSTILWMNVREQDFYYWQIRNLFEASDILFTNSDAESSKISKDFNIDISKFHKTRNSITADFFDLGHEELFRNVYDVKGDFVLCVGNIDQRKNTRALAEACHELDIPLIVIGAIRDVKYFDGFKNLFKNVRYLGPVYDAEMLKSAFKACSLFALPSLCETPGIAALEAASQGAKIVITSEGSTEEYFEKYGIYVDPLSKESIKSGILKGMNSIKDSNQIAFIRDRYSWDQTALDISEGYKKILKNN